MYNNCLTDEGIVKTVAQIPNSIVQLLTISYKIKGETRYIICDLSDGYTKLKNCAIVDEYVTSGVKSVKDMSVVQLTSFFVEPPKKNNTDPVIIIEKFRTVCTTVNKIIGHPIPYDEYLKNGKNNPDGDNTYANPQNKTIGARQQMAGQSTSSSYYNTRVRYYKGKYQYPREAIGKKEQNKKYVEEKRYSSYYKLTEFTNSRSVPKGGVKIDQKPKIGPIQVVNAKKYHVNIANDAIKGQMNRPNQEYNLVKNLFLGIENWIILVRVIFVSPMKQIMTKKGTYSSILSIEVGDKSGTMYCTIFGETANKFYNIFREDEVFEISSAQVVESTYMNKKYLKITLNDNTRVNLKYDNHKVPFAYDFCMTVYKMSYMQVGSYCRIICLIKDENEPYPFVSKAGKSLIRKMIFLCDPESKIEVGVTLWGEKTYLRFDKYPYMIGGILITEYNGTKQYTFKSNVYFRELKQHSLRRFIKDMYHISFTTLNSGQKGPRKTTITNFQYLNSNIYYDKGNGVWSEVVCFVNSIRTNFKNYYLSCPNCRKKATEETDGMCIHCNKHYVRAQYRYILNVNLVDAFDNIWATAYDEVAEVIMGINGKNFPADEFVTLSYDDIKERMEKIKMTEYKFKLVTKSESYNNEVRKKTNIIKILPLDYGEEANALHSKIAGLID